MASSTPPAAGNHHRPPPLGQNRQAAHSRAADHGFARLLARSGAPPAHTLNADHELSPRAGQTSRSSSSSRLRTPDFGTLCCRAPSTSSSRRSPLELGRKLHRDEVYIRAHTPKNGSAPKEETQRRFDDIKEAITLHPELVDSPIEKGDIFENVFGRDPRGYVRGLGLGPTPTSLGIDGWRKCTSTKVQRAFHSRDRAQEEVFELKGIVEHLAGEVIELKHAIKGRREETPRPADDHSRSRPTPPATLKGVDLEHNEHEFNEDCTENPNVEVVMPSSRMTPAHPRRNEGGGNEVILLSTERPRDVAVAKATVQSTDPEMRVGVCLLGDDCYEVVVSTVMRSDHLLPRQYGKLRTLGDSVGQSIAWPHIQIMAQERTSKHSKDQ